MTDIGHPYLPRLQARYEWSVFDPVVEQTKGLLAARYHISVYGAGVLLTWLCPAPGDLHDYCQAVITETVNRGASRARLTPADLDQWYAALFKSDNDA